MQLLFTEHKYITTKLLTLLVLPHKLKKTI